MEPEKTKTLNYPSLIASFVGERKGKRYTPMMVAMTYAPMTCLVALVLTFIVTGHILSEKPNPAKITLPAKFVCRPYRVVIEVVRNRYTYQVWKDGRLVIDLNEELNSAEEAEQKGVDLVLYWQQQIKLCGNEEI